MHSRLRRPPASTRRAQCRWRTSWSTWRSAEPTSPSTRLPVPPSAYSRRPGGSSTAAWRAASRPTPGAPGPSRCYTDVARAVRELDSRHDAIGVLLVEAARAASLPANAADLDRRETMRLPGRLPRWAVPEGRSRRRARVCWRQVHLKRPRREAPVRRSLAVIAMVVGTSIASPLLASERAGGPGVNSRCVGGTARRSAVPLPPARDGAASRARDARDARGRSRLGGRQRRDAREPGGRPAPSRRLRSVGVPSAAG